MTKFSVSSENQLGGLLEPASGAFPPGARGSADLRVRNYRRIDDIPKQRPPKGRVEGWPGQKVGRQLAED